MIGNKNMMIGNVRMEIGNRVYKVISKVKGESFSESDWGGESFSAEGCVV